METKHDKDAKDLVRLHIFQNQTSLVETVLKLEGFISINRGTRDYLGRKIQELDYPTWDDIVNLFPRRNIIELIHENPDDYEEFLKDNPDLLERYFFDQYRQWADLHAEDHSDMDEFLNWLDTTFKDTQRAEYLQRVTLDEEDIETLYAYLERNNNEITDSSREIFSWYLVSTWLAEQLEAKGETILRFYDQEWWGRDTFGQPVSADYVIIQIAKDLWGELNES